MPFETTTHVVSKPVPQAGQRLVHGRLVGPTDETYPPGTGGPIPNPKNIVHATTVTTTVRDVNSGHTRVKSAPHEAGASEDVDKAAIKAKASPGLPVVVGQPVRSETDPFDETDPAPASGEENAVEGEFGKLSDTDKEEFLQHEEAQAQAPKAAASAKPVVNKGPTTSRQLG